MGLGDFLKKAGLVEGGENEISPEELAAKMAEMKASMASTTTQEVPEGMDLDGLLTVDDIYSKFNLSDVSKSIFKVDEFANIPGIKDLATDIRRNAVLGTLAASGLNVDVLKNDASARISALDATMNGFTEETNEIVEVAEMNIKDLETRIDTLKQQIYDRKKLQETQAAVIKEEADKVKKIVNFISPENNG